MNSELRDLYQDVIVEHSKRPRNFRALAAPATSADGYNPLCGDKCTVYVELSGDTLRDVAFQGAGCAISTAAASVMTETLKGKTCAEADELFQGFHELVTKGPDVVDASGMGKLAVFAGVSEFPSRVKCATLAWHTLRAALDGSKQTVKTE